MSDDYRDLPPMWSRQCYVNYELSCPPEEVEAKFNNILKDFPTMQWGTHIMEKKYNKKLNTCHVTIRRFASQRECVRHSTIQPVED